MNARSVRLAILAVALAAFGLVSLPGCSKKAGGSLLPDERPSVELTNAPIAADRSNPYFYAYRVNWSGNDPDGRVDHYDYAIDPTATDTVWITTTKNEQIMFFRATQPDSIRGNNPATASDFHTFVIRAVDDRGMVSEPKYRSFFAYTIAPTVAIRNPSPSALLRAQVTPSVRIEWQGSDPDGQFTQKPVKYKWKMLDLDDPANQVFLVDPDSLRRREAPTTWAGWDSTSADTNFVQFTNLTPGKSYLFVVIAFDEAGAYSPVFTLNSNCLQLTAGFAASNGPKIRIFNKFIDFVYLSGGYSTDPLREIPVEVPTKIPIDVNWDAFPSPGSQIQFFRWMVDGNINDQTPRSDEQEDYIHWSQPSPTRPGATVLRPFLDGIHRFYLECGDNNGQKSLGILKITAVTPSFNRTLLIIDDTRLEPDKFVSDPSKRTPDTYTKPWPSRSEMDTFFFARGGVPWRGTKNPPYNPPVSFVNTVPGVFAGYDFDTLGTRLGLENPGRAVLLSKIGQYKNLIWFVDSDGASFDGTASQASFPLTALRAMSGPGLASTLSAYTALGGRVWLSGGGGAYATLVNFDKRNNNKGQTTVFQSIDPYDELAPSRIMFDGAHWQSSMGVTKAATSVARFENTVKTPHPGGPPVDTTYIVAPAWSHPDAFNIGGQLDSPDYRKLPDHLHLKDGSTTPGFGVPPDPVPPTRTSAQTGSFYQSSLAVEYILDLNAIVEDVDPDPGVSHEISVLDTLYQSSSVVLLTDSHTAPTMTYYHGGQAHQFIFSGFGIWAYARQDVIGLVDFVLQDIWGLTRQGIDRSPSVPGLQPGVNARGRGVTTGPRPVSVRVPTGTIRE